MTVIECDRGCDGWWALVACDDGVARLLHADADPNAVPDTAPPDSEWFTLAAAAVAAAQTQPSISVTAEDGTVL